MSVGFQGRTTRIHCSTLTGSPLDDNLDGSQ
jgi:hypothetical protein